MSAGKKAKKNASNQSGGTWDEDTDEGVDLSTAAEMWSEDELRQLIREEALKLLGNQQPIQPSPWATPPFNPTPSYPQPYQWSQTGQNTNHLYDGHVTVNCSAGELVGASS